MHEIGLMDNALRAAGESLKASGYSSIRVLRMKVGRLSGVVPDSLRFAFEALSPGSPAEGATLEIVETPSLCYCTSCRREFIIDRYDYICPHCDSLDIELRSGREVELTTMEVA